MVALSSFEKQFNDNMRKLGKISRKAFEALMAYPPQTWCQAFFSSRCKSNIIDNNISESFISWIFNA